MFHLLQHSSKTLCSRVRSRTMIGSGWGVGVRKFLPAVYYLNLSVFRRCFATYTATVDSLIFPLYCRLKLLEGEVLEFILACIFN